MKTVDLAGQALSAAELFKMARAGSIVVKTAEGDSFLVSPADEFASEVELLRRNHAFLTMLDKLKSEKATVPLDEVEKRFR